MYHYQKNIGDYRSATMHLSLLEHGVYNQLLDWYYLDELPLPIDNRTLFRRLSARSEIEQQAVLDVLEEMFTRTENGWIHSRVEREIAQYKAKSQQAREAGKLGGRPSKKGDGSENNRDGFENKPDAKPTANQEPLTNNQLNKEPIGSLSTRTKSERTLPDCPHKKIIELWAKHLPNLTQPRTWEGSRKTNMRNRWAQASRPSAYSPTGYATEDEGVGWWDAFFAYIANDTKLAAGFESNGRTWQPDLEWVVNASNFQKIIDGKYNK